MLPLALIPYKGKILMALGLGALLLLTHTSAYFVGRSHASKAQAKAEASVLKDELEAKILEGKENALVAEETGRKAAEMEARLELALEKLNDAIEKSNRVGCDLTDAELDGLQAIRDSYR